MMEMLLGLQHPGRLSCLRWPYGLHPHDSEAPESSVCVKPADAKVVLNQSSDSSYSLFLFKGPPASCPTAQPAARELSLSCFFSFMEEYIGKPCDSQRDRAPWRIL